MKWNMMNISVWYCRSLEKMSYMANLASANFGKKDISFLGYIISEGGIYVDPSKVKDVIGIHHRISQTFEVFSVWQDTTCDSLKDSLR
jgi:hypothetical protein